MSTTPPWVAAGPGRRKPGDLLGVRKVIDGEPTRYQCATAFSIAAPLTALVE